MDPLAEWRQQWPVSTSTSSTKPAREGGANDTYFTDVPAASPPPPSSYKKLSGFGSCDEATVPRGIDYTNWITSFVEFQQAGVVAYAPQCKWRAVVRAYRGLWGSSLPPSEKLRVSVDALQQTLTLTQSLVYTTPDEDRLPLARFGTLLRAHYLQEKFHLSALANEKGSTECRRNGRQCWLVSGGGYVVADLGVEMGRPYRVEHLAAREKDLFGQLMRVEVEGGRLVQR